MFSYLTDEQVKVIRNDALESESIENYTRVVLSPGPGLPANAGQLNKFIQTISFKIPILGVCLGHQALCEVHGGRLKNLSYPFHGVSRTIRITASDEPIFKGLPDKFNAGHYHSWVVDGYSLPDVFQVTAVDQDENIMAVSDRQGWLKGIQFHPESILTIENGGELISNWLAFSNTLIMNSMQQLNINQP